MQRVREVAPAHAPSLLTLAELYVAQRAWPEAVLTLESVAQVTNDVELRLTALFALGSIYDKILGRPDEHERVLRDALVVQPDNPRALRTLVDHLRDRHTTIPGKRGSEISDDVPATREITSLLRRLAEAETDPLRKSDAYLEAAGAEAAAGDRAAAEQSILEAVVCCPSNARAFARLTAHFHGDSGLDTLAYARALQEVITRGREANHLHARWFAALGRLEVDKLQRLPEGIAHLASAVQLDPTLHETRFELAGAQARAGSERLAIQGLLSLLIPDARPLTSLPNPGAALALLERLLEKEREPEEAVVVTELRALLGEADRARIEALSARSLAPFAEYHTPLGRSALIEKVLPPAGRHILLEVAHASAGLDCRLVRANLADLGVQTRNRVGSRSGHPVRPAFDRARVALGVDGVELIVSSAVDRVRVVVQDTACVIVPSFFESLHEGVQVAAFARALARVLLGVPWLMELSESAVVGWLLAVVRHVAPGYMLDDPDSMPSEVVTYEPQVARAMGRRQRKLLDRLVAQLLLPESRPPEPTSFVRAINQCTARAAYLVAGDFAATARAVALDDARLADTLAHPGLPSLEALLGHAIAGDVARFALTREATLLRQPLGAVWLR